MLMSVSQTYHGEWTRKNRARTTHLTSSIQPRRPRLCLGLLDHAHKLDLIPTIIPRIPFRRLMTLPGRKLFQGSFLALRLFLPVRTRSNLLRPRTTPSNRSRPIHPTGRLDSLPDLMIHVMPSPLFPDLLELFFQAHRPVRQGGSEGLLRDDG